MSQDQSGAADNLHQALIEGDHSNIPSLIKAGSLLLVWPGRAGNACIHIASQLGKKELLEDLLNFGCDPNAIGADGNRPLHIACMADDKEASALLIKNGARKDFKNNAGDSPLDIAYAYGASSCIALLSPKPDSEKSCGSLSSSKPKSLEELHRSDWNQGSHSSKIAAEARRLHYEIQTLLSSAPAFKEGYLANQSHFSAPNLKEFIWESVFQISLLMIGANPQRRLHT